MRGRNGTSHRAERIGSIIKRDVAVIIDGLSDPRIHGVDVVDAEMSRDLRYATVFVSIENDDKKVLDALNGSAGYIRNRLAEENSEMRGVPRLNFVIDKSQAYYERIEELIKGFHSNDGNND
ncbi:MAG: 30S ribosome-binding factor RbfA [Clostridiales bacterium]|nr:30S ribosome-binding factor RbfA [Clostridiales bacterium]